MSVSELASLGRGYYCAMKCEKCSDLSGRGKFGWQWTVVYLVKEHICMNSIIGPPSAEANLTPGVQSAAPVIH